jgi:hypothetical protein
MTVIFNHGYAALAMLLTMQALAVALSSSRNTRSHAQNGMHP